MEQHRYEGTPRSLALPDTSAPCTATDKDELGIDFRRVKVVFNTHFGDRFEELLASAPTTTHLLCWDFKWR
ncbi:hypothetical protein CK227_24415 [Mesorhizobium sp. WSM4308]|nr:hypothetical protein CK227_24415 [Mesorhizobium sp. WSM4308]